MHDNKITHYSENLFEDLPNLMSLISDDYVFCCLAGYEKGKIQDCVPSTDIFSSCTDLIQNEFLRVVLWFIGLIAFVGNLIALVRQAGLEDTDRSKVSMFLITNLAVADLCMGAFLMTIAVADVYFRGIYVTNARQWRQSTFCTAAGALASVSMSMTVIILTIMTLQRVLVVMFPFTNYHLSQFYAKVILILAWTTSAVMATLPTLNLEYFDEEYYGRTGMCISVPLFSEKTPGWEFATFNFVLLPFLGSVVVIGSFFGIRYIVKRTEEFSGLRTSMTEQKLVTLINTLAYSNCLFWIPLVLISTAVLGGSTVNANLYGWTVMFLIPFNSALNPVMFTYASIKIEHKRRAEAENERELDPRIAQAIIQDIAITRIFFVIPPSRAAHLSMTSWLAASEDNFITNVDIKSLIGDIKTAISHLHKRELYHGSVDFDHLLVDDEDETCLRGFLLAKINHEKSTDLTKAEDERQVRSMQQDLNRVLQERKEVR
ncbi:G-protein coupled receptor GRL101-like [Saccoglossus kowalevskii]